MRISFFGGGTDFREYFLQEEGCVLSSAINRSVFVIIKERFNEQIRVSYTKTEIVDHIDELQHELVRECLRKTGISKRVEIATMADIPSAGSGIGSSSTVTVGLLNAMYEYLGISKELTTLAEEACEIEIDVLGKPIGLQDQYIAAHGGQCFIRFGKDGRVQVNPVKVGGGGLRSFDQNLMLFFTNITRKAETVLAEQVKNINGRLIILRQMKQLALEAKDCLESGEMDQVGILMDQGWELKKQLADGISNDHIDEIYDAARKAGALGGKIAGAGGGGFLLLYCPKERQDRVRSSLSRLRELPFNLQGGGSEVILNHSSWEDAERVGNEYRILSL